MIYDPLYDAYVKTLKSGPLHSVQRLMGDLAVESELHGEDRISILYVWHKLQDILSHGGVKPPEAQSWIPLDRFSWLEDIEAEEEDY